MGATDLLFGVDARLIGGLRRKTGNIPLLKKQDIPGET
jgi:hypothetical protein